MNNTMEEITVSLAYRCIQRDASALGQTAKILDKEGMPGWIRDAMEIIRGLIDETAKELIRQYPDIDAVSNEIYGEMGCFLGEQEGAEEGAVEDNQRVGAHDVGC